MRRFVVLGVGAILLAGCGKADKMSLSGSAVSTDAIAFQLALKKQGEPFTPRGGTVSATVTDVDFSGDPNAKSVVVCQGSGPPTPTGAYRFATSCPPLKPTTNRDLQVVYRVTGPFEYSVAQQVSLQSWVNPAGLTKAPPKVDRFQAAFQSALPQVPASGPDRPCDDRLLASVNPRDLANLKTASWDDAARAYGVAGAQPLSDGLFPMQGALDYTNTLLYVFRAASVRKAVYNPQTKTYVIGAASGTGALVHVPTGKVVCSATVQAQNQASLDVFQYSNAGERQSSLDINLRYAIEKAIDAKMKSMSKVLR